MKSYVKAPAILLAAATVATTAFAQNDLPAPVKARKAHMSLYGFNIGPLAGMAQGKMEYDAETAEAAAENLAALSGQSTARYWQPDTDNASLEGTRALPAIWENLDDVAAKEADLHEAAVALAGTAGDGLDALKAGLGPVGKACGACHEDYREAD